MKTVLLLGAGASVAEAISQGIPREKLPPTDNNLLEYCYNTLGALGEVDVYALNEFGIDIFTRNVSAEQVFNMFYSNAIEDKGVNHEGWKKLYFLKKMYRLAIAQATNQVGSSTDGPLYRLIDSINSRTDFHDLTIITFNYDVIVEKILHTFKSKTSGEPIFNIGSSYRIDWDNLLISKDPKDSEFKVGIVEEGVPVLKLHGSLNWLRGVKNIEKEIEPIQCEPDKFYIYKGESIYSDFTLKEIKKDLSVSDSYGMFPFIIPPVYEKSKHFTKLLTPLWEKAAEAIINAERVVIFGYSLPVADVKAQILLASSISKATNLRQREIIDIRPEVCSRYVNGIGLRSFKYYSDWSEYVISNPHV